MTTNEKVWSRNLVLAMLVNGFVLAAFLGQTATVPIFAHAFGASDIQVALFETEKQAIIKLLRTSIAPHDPPLHYYMLQGTRGFIETDRKGPVQGRCFVEGEMERAQDFEVKLSDESLPESARAGGHGTAEYGVLQEFLRSLTTGQPPSLDAPRAMDLTVPGLIAHESAMQGGIWLDVPSFA